MRTRFAGWSPLSVGGVLLLLPKSIRAMAAAALAAGTPLQVVLTREHHETILKVIIDAFHEEFGHLGTLARSSHGDRSCFARHIRTTPE